MLIAAGAAALVAIAAGVAALAWVILPDDDKSPQLQPLPTTTLSVDEVSALLQQEMNRPGQVFHMTVETHQSGIPAYSIRNESWTDAARGLRREKSSYTYAGGSAEPLEMEALLTAEYRYSRDRDEPVKRRPAPTCQSASGDQLSWPNCPISKENSWTVALNGEFEGRPSVILARLWDFSSEDDGRGVLTEVTYLDAETMLPLASSSDGTLHGGVSRPQHSTSRFHTEFISSESLPADFFDPQSIGYLEQL